MNMIKVSINYLPEGIGANSPIDKSMKLMTLKLTLEELKLLKRLWHRISYSADNSSILRCPATGPTQLR